MHKPESARENATHKILWGFEMQTNHLIPVRRQDLMLISKKKDHRVSFAIPVDHWGEMKENEKIDKYVDLAWEQK